MENNARIVIKTVQEPLDGSKPDTIELETMGKFTRRNGKFYIMYEESALTGFENTTTTVKIGEENVTLLRRGNVESRMEFIGGDTRLCRYPTPYGDLFVGVKVLELSHSLSEDGGELHLSYILDLDNESYAKNTLSLAVKLKD